ncbi:MAG: c-type cytochrome [Gammaproteobacteria bacterium]
MSASHSEPEVFTTHNIAVLGGLLLLAVFIGEVLIGPHRDQAPVAEPKAEDSVQDIAMRLKPVITLAQIRDNMSAAAGAADNASKSPEQLYQGACMACHGTGAAGAPKLGDSAAWAPRLSQGIDTLLNAAINGIGAMPPRGGSQYSDEQIRSVIEYMASKAE